MTNLWRCHSWRGPADSVPGDIEPVEDWNSPEGAVEFLRRHLSAQGHYSKDALVNALTELRLGRPVRLWRDLGNGDALHLEVVPDTA
ncbi:hypothetical protein [Actinomadura oligospora]|uniref:hypothetical protein n=1 Tax=Actinomadura oligospora TaxID=111804 RepID=UPI00047EE751|nr:hypothetical protein [Actinomadura oligospora]